MTTVRHDTRLGDYLGQWEPPEVLGQDGMDPGRAAALAAILDLDDNVVEGDRLPPLWHWVYFGEWPATGSLGVDGHPRTGPFLPPIPDRRRMFAGGRLRIVDALTVGQPCTKRSRVANSVVKAGRNGELLFVTVRSEYHQRGKVKIVEEQDLVYRSDASTTPLSMRKPEPLPPNVGEWCSEPGPTSVTLFRFSAATANSHRIHYDKPYATAEEGFPDLVVHGPLLGLYMSELLRDRDSRQVRRFDFTLRKPVFLGDPIRVEGEPDGATVQLSVVSAGSAAHATATATMA